MSATKSEFMDVINYRDMVRDIVDNFGYDADCDQDGFFDCTNYEAEYDYWITQKYSIQQDDPDYYFLAEVLDFYIKGHSVVSDRVWKFIKYCKTMGAK